ncbi:amino acid deaminase [Bradyrhizobium japonicum]|uniref:amino acid deaminase n=1 Tax=Bradyrhizobium japonicum TaxID=375 RepID=UPI000456801A|nr:amino acid deaminase [Bradyrhizobium japonicum]AHY51208.1 D-serine deaminase [Bradyrhizobium japonicum SEMIA 5079]MCD9105059.1 amino acid deaminase [Bradyrhizobium japonicum]MCD9255102.1 amino acid deaminase [Bradyrhizobium japonicum SEMIA 5079]MCD9819938.1 amino acid deaminase [Bradyrhizobium japonicum]MCD9892185.1 amino acid deaminase [Bradyrhizobium japonicum]
MQFLSRWESQRLSSTTRGIPLVDGLPIEEIAGQNWQPSRGDLALPALTLDEAAFAANRDLFLRWCESAGVSVAPHAKTPMSPELALSLREAGAWGTTVANIQQAAVLLASGERRLLLANEIGGLAAGRRLGALLGAYSDVEFHAFADSPAAVAALAEAARIAGRGELSVLVELGAGRAGARDRAAIEATIAAVLAADRLILGGVATYEGAVATPDADETMRAIAALMERTIAAFALVRHAAPGRPLIISAGGSAYFDVVARALAPSAQADGNASILLRSGALFFADHGIYARAFAELDRRGGLAIDGARHSATEGFRPALTLWAEVLSRPEAGLAIAGFGMRDASFDQGLPVPLRAFRDGVEQQGLAETLSVTRLNDQHAFLSVAPDSTLGVGDIIAFGISHPCTCLDRWRVVLGLDADGVVTRALPTQFG